MREKEEEGKREGGEERCASDQLPHGAARKLIQSDGVLGAGLAVHTAAYHGALLGRRGQDGVGWCKEMAAMTAEKQQQAPPGRSRWFLPPQPYI